MCKAQSAPTTGAEAMLASKVTQTPQKPWYNEHGEIVSWRNRKGLATASLIFLAVPSLAGVIYMGADRWDALLMILSWFCTASTALVMNHRYFAHTAFKVNRVTRFFCGIVACLGLQYGPVWWSSKHRRHHKKCDVAGDPHSWKQSSFWFAWWGWTMTYEERKIDVEYVHPSLFVDHSERQLPQLLIPEQSTDGSNNSKDGKVIAAELLLLDKFWFVPTLVVQFGLLLLGVSARSVFFYYSAPVTFVPLPILLFNVMFHPPDNTPTTAGCYALDSMLDPLTFLMGESHHEDHHVVPDRARRPGPFDMSYLTVICPMVLLGLAWDAKVYNTEARKLVKEKVVKAS